MLKIAMIGHKKIPSREGGVEIVVEELAARMAAQGHTVHVYNRGGEHVSGAEFTSRESRQKEYRGIRLITVPTPSNRSLNALVYSFLATVRALLGGYDVIHYHAEGPCAMLRIPHLFGIPTVATIHGLDWQRGKWGGFASKYLLFGEKTAAKKADEVVVLSKNVQDYFKETYGRDVAFIPNAVNRPRLLPANIIKEKHGLEKDGFLLFLARLVPEKGLHYLLEAFSRIQTDKKLVVAGGSSHSDAYVEEVRRLAARDSRVIMTGFVQGEELEELFSNCLLYILPSDVEGMPLSLLEAMSYGCRCLTSDIPENTEMTGAYAHAFPHSDVEALAESLTGILGGGMDFPEPEAIAEYCLSRFNWDDITRQYVDLYVRHNKK